MFHVAMSREKLSPKLMSPSSWEYDKPVNKSIDEIMNTLNDPQIFRELGHNRKMLSRLLPLKNLVTQLDKY